MPRKLSLLGSDTLARNTSCRLKDLTSLMLYVAVYLYFGWYAISESVPMKSLRCHNDYNSLVTCTWKEHFEARALLGLTLYQWNVIKK
uniref:Cytokine receptor common subunit beta N-terminal domain-containing protein n=1 Tax=Meleagris gallopavo TaxID=9103 RepID=A0A803YES3_MELGA